MRDKNSFRDKKITIVGFARSGLACANLLYDLGARVSVTDNQDSTSARANLLKLKSKEIKVELGAHSQEFIRGQDLIVISPGVPLEATPVVWARKFGIELISEIELASLLCPARIIAVTGTNGKTTVTTLIGAMIRAWGKKAFVCGNIGNPFSAEIPKMGKGDFVSLEVSSFQLETTKTFRPYISLILNFSRNHLDRYKDMQDYLRAKKRIFLNQGADDYLVLNKQDPLVGALAAEAKAKVVYFGLGEGLNPNQAAVLSVASILGIKKELALGVFAEFKGVEHRLEEVSQLNGIKFINDSKATTVDATIWALRNIAHPVILIAGGREKGNDYSIIKDLVREKVRELILIGEAREKIGKIFKGILSVQEASSLKEAVGAAFSKAKPGDSVLLSPMCKSFDMFSDYEHRGRVFKEEVLSLVNNRD